MTDGGVPYGGYNWMQNLQAQLQQLLGFQQQYGMATGWMQPAVTQVPTKTSAFEAIFQSRPDLQEQKERKYADWSVNRYMQHWWEGSGEMSEGRHWTDPSTGHRYTNIKDVSPVEFAIARGYVDPGPNPSGTYGFQSLPEAETGEAGAGYPWERYVKPEREPTLAREQFEQQQIEQNRQYLRSMGLDEEQIGQFERVQTETEEARQMQNVLQYMGLQTQAQGPRNWLQYGALQRGAAQTQIPEWQQRLTQGLGFAPFQGGAPMPTTGFVPPGGEGQVIPTEGVQFAPEAGWQQGLMNQAMQYIQPHQISPQQWQGMMPSEREMLMGQVETPTQLGGWGGYAPDYLEQMMKSWPTGQMQGVSQFAGW